MAIIAHEEERARGDRSVLHLGEHGSIAFLGRAEHNILIISACFLFAGGAIHRS
jgi:hypothetical protein